MIDNIFDDIDVNSPDDFSKTRISFDTQKEIAKRFYDYLSEQIDKEILKLWNGII